MGSESGLRTTLKKKISDQTHYIRVENTCGTGTPDVNFAWNGHEKWVELKYLAKFPVRKTTKVTLSCFTLDQITWILSRWCVKKGSTYLFVQVGDKYYLFNAHGANKVYHGVTTMEFKELAIWSGGKGWNGDELLLALEYPPISAF